MTRNKFLMKTVCFRALDVLYFYYFIIFPSYVKEVWSKSESSDQKTPVGQLLTGACAIHDYFKKKKNKKKQNTFDLLNMQVWCLSGQNISQLMLTQFNFKAELNQLTAQGGKQKYFQ